jgi:hypothetical protein
MALFHPFDIIPVVCTAIEPAKTTRTIWLVVFPHSRVAFTIEPLKNALPTYFIIGIFPSIIISVDELAVTSAMFDAAFEFALVCCGVRPSFSANTFLEIVFPSAFVLKAL